MQKLNLREPRLATAAVPNTRDTAERSTTALAVPLPTGVGNCTRDFTDTALCNQQGNQFLPGVLSPR